VATGAHDGPQVAKADAERAARTAAAIIVLFKGNSFLVYNNIGLALVVLDYMNLPSVL
jgi:hypothetical protein